MPAGAVFLSYASEDAPAAGRIAAALRAAGAEIVGVALPASFEQGGRDVLPLCSVETALAHEATYPSRAAEYGPVLAGLIDMGHRLSGIELARLQERRAALTGELNNLLVSIDLLLVPVMGTAVWTIKGIEAAGRDPETLAAVRAVQAREGVPGNPLAQPGHRPCRRNSSCPGRSAASRDPIPRR